MSLIKLLSTVFLVAILSSCSYHSNTYPTELKNPEILTKDFLDGSSTISVRNDEIEFPKWSFRIFGKRILPKLNSEQILYVRDLERLRKLHKHQQKISRIRARNEAKIKKLKVKNETEISKLQKKIDEINNFPDEEESFSSSFGIGLYTHKYKKKGFDYIYNEKTLFWGVIKWGKRKA